MNVGWKDAVPKSWTILEIGTARAGKDKIAAIGQTVPMGTPCLVKCRWRPLLFEQDCQSIQIRCTFRLLVAFLKKKKSTTELAFPRLIGAWVASTFFRGSLFYPLPHLPSAKTALVMCHLTQSSLGHKATEGHCFLSSVPVYVCTRMLVEVRGQ